MQYHPIQYCLTFRDNATAAMMDPSDTKNDGRLFGNIVYEGIRPSITDEDFQPPPQVAKSYPLHPRLIHGRDLPSCHSTPPCDSRHPLYPFSPSCPRALTPLARAITGVRRVPADGRRGSS
jgi:hypothetical protein